jgi:hypothetical protein
VVVVVIGIGGRIQGLVSKECSRGMEEVSATSVSDVHHKIPESFSAFWRIVSFTAAKTRRMFEVSVACVRLDGC